MREPSESGRTLALHMYVLTSEALHVDQASATAVVLLVIVIGINAVFGLYCKEAGEEDRRIEMGIMKIEHLDLYLRGFPGAQKCKYGD